MLKKLNCGFFTWSAWRSGSPADLFVVCREPELVAMRKVLKAHAIGWCCGESLLCRPKLKHKAVMFLKNDNIFWFHLTDKEFGAIFYD